jgi:hypothetical protein
VDIFNPTESAREDSDSIQVGPVLATPQFALIAAAGGSNTIVALVAGKLIRVLQYTFTVGGSPLQVTWQSSVSGAVSGAMPYSAGQGITTPYCPVGLVQTVTGEALVMFLTGGSVAGHLTYILV